MSRDGISQARKQFREDILAHLDTLSIGVFDVLVLTIPGEVIEDEDPDKVAWTRYQRAAEEIAELAERPVIMLPEGTQLAAENIEPILREMGAPPPPPDLLLPKRGIIRP